MMVLRPVRKNAALLLSILLILNSLVLCVSAKEKADTVYINGNIYTVDSRNSKATAMAINDQHLIYVGENSKAEEFIGNKTKVIDLEGKTVLPGIIEGHMHFPMLGENLIKIDAYWKPKQEIIDAVKPRQLNFRQENGLKVLDGIMRCGMIKVIQPKKNWML